MCKSLDASDYRAMANSTIYTRAYSTSSAGKLVSAKGPKGDPLSRITLLKEFDNHSKIWNREPTALVSASDRIIDTLNRAFDKLHGHDESSAEVWIAFLEVPSTIDEDIARIHSAKELAEECELSEPKSFVHEVVFEWAVPDKYVLHQVSLQTLMNRGLKIDDFLQPSTAESSTVEVRHHVARGLQPDGGWHGPWEIGLHLGSFAEKFGARAPLDWISHQLFHDCVHVTSVKDDLFRLNYAPGNTKIVGSHFFREMDDGIKTSLYEWWFGDTNFIRDCDEFNEWRDVSEEGMTWDMIGFWETWRDVDYDELSREEKLLYDEQIDNLLAEHENKRADIEAKAIKIGL